MQDDLRHISFRKAGDFFVPFGIYCLLSERNFVCPPTVFTPHTFPPPVLANLFQFYIKPQRVPTCTSAKFRCFLFQFYIKPQLDSGVREPNGGCFLFQFYIKPQPITCSDVFPDGCFLFQFYIKPQLTHMESNIYFVVSYFNSTSNHNQRRFCNQTQLVVSYFNSTSNHNMQPAGPSRFRGCFLFQFYIKPQPYIEKLDEFDSCFLFQFYIKPQHPATARADVRGCFLFQKSQRLVISYIQNYVTNM